MNTEEDRKEAEKALLKRAEKKHELMKANASVFGPDEHGSYVAAGWCKQCGGWHFGAKSMPKKNMDLVYKEFASLLGRAYAVENLILEFDKHANECLLFDPDRKFEQAPISYKD